MLRALVLFWCLFTTSAQCGERVNTDQVLACLDREGSAVVCEGTLLAPCASMARQGFLRACAYRLRLRWEALLDQTVRTLFEALPRSRAEALAAEADQWRERIARDCPADHRAAPETASIRRNSCRIRRLASLWAVLIRDTPKLFAPGYHDQ